MPTTTKTEPAEEPTWFTKLLIWLAAGLTQVCEGLKDFCLFTIQTGRLLLKILLLLGAGYAILTWRHIPIEGPKTFLVACTLGILAANLGECALGNQGIEQAIKLPLALSILLYWMPIQAIAQAIQQF